MFINSLIKQIKSNYLLLPIIVTFIFLITIVSCKKEPELRFSTDKSHYIIGEMIHIKNLSKDGKRYTWSGNLINGINNNKDIDIRATSIGFKSITLMTDPLFGKDGHFHGEILIHEPPGQITFYTMDSTVGTISIDGGYDYSGSGYGGTKQITQSFSYTPNCGSSGCATFTDFGGKKSWHYWSTSNSSLGGYIEPTIKSGECIKVKLF